MLVGPNGGPTSDQVEEGVRFRERSRIGPLLLIPASQVGESLGQPFPRRVHGCAFARGVPPVAGAAKSPLSAAGRVEIAEPVRLCLSICDAMLIDMLPNALRLPLCDPQMSDLGDNVFRGESPSFPRFPLQRGGCHPHRISHGKERLGTRVVGTWDSYGIATHWSPPRSLTVCARNALRTERKQRKQRSWRRSR